jgi:hypothetical protein
VVVLGDHLQGQRLQAGELLFLHFLPAFKLRVYNQVYPTCNIKLADPLISFQGLILALHSTRSFIPFPNAPITNDAHRLTHPKCCLKFAKITLSVDGAVDVGWPFSAWWFWWNWQLGHCRIGRLSANAMHIAHYYVEYKMRWELG